MVEVMQLKIVIFLFWILTGNWTKSVAQEEYTRFCSLRICSAHLITRLTDRRIELGYCNDLISEDFGNRQTTITISCASFGNPDACNSLHDFRETCSTTTEMPEPTDDSTTECPPCPFTVADYSITTHDPYPTDDSTTRYPPCPTIAECSTTTHDPQPSYTDCPTMPSYAPISTMPTSTTESEASSQINKVIDERDNLMVTVTSLGVLVGVLVVLLIVVTSGWMWTCWRMKRNKTITPEHVRTTQNTAYGVIELVGNFTRGQTSGHQERQTENEYQIMNVGGGGDNGEEHEYHVLEGLGGDRHIHQNRQLEMRQVNESGGEHAYHILEGPGDDDASKEPGMREVDGAMDYEIPLPLKNE